MFGPLAEKFPAREGAAGFEKGRLHSFRHFFFSPSANRMVPQQTVMRWLGYKDSKLVDLYYHVHDDEAHHQMGRLRLSNEASGAKSAGGK